MLPASAGAIADPQTAPKATIEDIKPKFTLPINSAVMTGLIIDISPCGPPWRAAKTATNNTEFVPT